MPTLYYNNVSLDPYPYWDVLSLWFEDDACTIQASESPWNSSTAYLDYDLTRSSLDTGAPINIGAFGVGDVNRVWFITGTCDISGIVNNGPIYSGTFSGTNFNNSNGGSIYGGTFTGNYFDSDNMSYIYGGKFSGIVTQCVYASGGLFDITTGLTMPIGSDPFYGATLFDFTLMSSALFLGGTSWSSSSWYEDYECTIPWTGDIPWTTSSTATKHLLRGNASELFNILTIPIAIDPSTIGDGFAISGQCYIGYQTNGSDQGNVEIYSYIYDGTFSGNRIRNFSNFLNGGTFTGDGFINAVGAYIYGGTFTGDGFINTGGAYIYGGTFSGTIFYNEDGAYIYGGTFSGDYLTNNFSYIYGGNFSGTYFNNMAGYIYDGTFTGDYLTNYSAYVYGGTFSGSQFINSYGTIQGGTFTGSYFQNNDNSIVNGGTFTGIGFYNNSSTSTVRGGYFSGDSFTNYGGTILGGAFPGDNFIHDNAGYIFNGIFSGAGFVLQGGAVINGGSWLQSGSANVPILDEYLTLLGYNRISGKNIANPYPIPGSAMEGPGFVTIKIAGQDVLGGGLI